MKTFRFVTSAAFVLGATLVTLPALAETTSAAARTAADPVYVCESCKTYYTEADARKMKMLDLGGHTLVKMDSAPAGYKMASYQQGGGGNMQGGNMQGGGMMQNNMMMMSDMDMYKMRWVYVNLDDREMKRYMALGYDEMTIKGAANIALRTGLDIGYVLRRLTITGLPLTRLAIMLGVPATVLGEDIPGMGMGMMMMPGMSGGMGMSGTGMQGGGMQR